MAIGWLAVLQTVPWGDVIANAPRVADGAKKLWNAVGKRSHAGGAAAEGAPSKIGDGHDTPALRAQLAELEAATEALHAQMLASSELIKALADQNTQLIQRVEANRLRVVWLAWATAASGAVAVGALAVALLR